MDDQEYALLIPFEDDPSPSFVNGYEAGMIDERLRLDRQAHTFPVHQENMRVLSKIAQLHGYEVEFHVTEVAGWLEAEFSIPKTRFPVVGGSNG